MKCNSDQQQKKKKKHRWKNKPGQKTCTTARHDFFTHELIAFVREQAKKKKKYLLISSRNCSKPTVGASKISSLQTKNKKKSAFITGHQWWYYNCCLSKHLLRQADTWEADDDDVVEVELVLADCLSLLSMCWSVVVVCRDKYFLLYTRVHSYIHSFIFWFILVIISILKEPQTKQYCKKFFFCLCFFFPGSKQWNAFWIMLLLHLHTKLHL